MVKPNLLEIKVIVTHTRDRYLILTHVNLNINVDCFTFLTKFQITLTLHSTVLNYMHTLP
jgi:hypothetical protein